MDDSYPVARLNQALAPRYRIERELGEGGMATVYLALDARHNRHVAIKVLKPKFTAVLGAERFLAEIETTARLQHPHILPLFDSGEADGSLFYVMPYVEGETLQDRIDRERQLPVDEALRITRGVADALQTAHQAGIVHRDIKPANILLSRGEPLVADFGIALAVDGAADSRLTESGLIVGTPRYMSPEQITGDQRVGPASDVFSLACVLYELLVGEPPYAGRSTQIRLTRLIQGAPISAAAVRKSVPAHVDAALRKALEKLPADRFTEAAGFARALVDPSFRYGDVTATPPVGLPWRVATFGLAATSVAFAAFAARALSAPDPPGPTIRLSVLLPEPQVGTLGTIGLSGDGSTLVYEGPGAERSHQLWIRRWSELHASPLPGTEGGVHPTFSPDGQEIAYMDRGTRQSLHNRLMVTPTGGGVPRVLHESIRGYAFWGRDGYVYFMDADTEGISRIAGSGGAVDRLTERQEGDGTPHFSPHLVTEGNAVLFTVGVGDEWHIRAVDLSTRDVTPPIAEGLRPHYTQSGHLVYLSPSGDITAAPFDASAMKPTGPGVPVIRGVRFNRFYSPLFVSENGTLVYGTAATASRYQPVWLDRDGAVTEIDPGWGFDPGGTPGLALSEDGTRLAVTIMNDVAEDVWIKDLPLGPLLRLTAGSTSETRPRWLPDGRVAYASIGEGPGALYARAGDGTGDAELLLSHDRQIQEGVLSADGEWLLARVGSSYRTAGEAPGRDVIGMRRGTEDGPTPFLASGFEEKAIALSPDGRWLAYVSDETGRDEVYVRPFPDVDASKRAISANGGIMPLWSRGGDAIFYVNAAHEMVEARITTAPAFTVLDSETLFPIGPDFLIWQNGDYTLYDIGPDDARFVMLRLEERETRELILVMNWLDELKERVPN